MISFVLITISILSILYLLKLIKYKFINQKNDFIRNIQIGLYVTTFLPLLTVGLLAYLDNEMIALSTTIIYLIIYLSYILYKKHRVKDFIDNSGDVTGSTRISDANGAINMKDDTVILNGATNNANDSLDYNRSFEVPGRTLITAACIQSEDGEEIESATISGTITEIIQDGVTAGRGN